MKFGFSYFFYFDHAMSRAYGNAIKRSKSDRNCSKTLFEQLPRHLTRHKTDRSVKQKYDKNHIFCFFIFSSYHDQFYAGWDALGAV